MKLVERHIITKCHPCWSEIDRAAFLSKNLFNLANYHYRQYFFVEHKKLNFNQLYHQVAQSSDLLFYRIAALAEGTGEQTADSIG
ncbi:MULTISPECIES: transposase [unclassified Microcystis]|jgi:hypothetical protein|uniref:transposase n=1 Tax=unclassified Microcystis TaxID=2643300 RepID=UPI0022BB55D4|nr:transposase [Microcystis sp. LE19-195.1E]MCZ8249317.1 transposase [Microcystis sp. LE19-195.1E]